MNFGLTKQQAAHTLPVGQSAPTKPVPLAKQYEKPELTTGANNTYHLRKGWKLTSGNEIMNNNTSVFDENFNDELWHNAKVPGTVLTSLVKTGHFPDPYYGLNNMAIPDSLCRQDWWYRTSFKVPNGEKGKKAWLIFQGINYKARVWLNGHKLGEVHGAFSRGYFQISGKIREDGNNVLLVQILPPHNPGIPHEQSAQAGAGPNGGQLALDGPTFISSEGWDWVPGIRDRNMGIWQDVSLMFTGSVTTKDVQIITDLPLPDTTTASLMVKTLLENNSPAAQTCTISFQTDGVLVKKNITLGANERKEITLDPDVFKELKLNHPKLWWPNGYGKPHLYEGVFTIYDNKGHSQTHTIKFGVREYEYELMADTQDKKNWRFSYSPTDLKSTDPVFDYSKRREFEKRIFIPAVRDGIALNKFKTTEDQTNPFLIIKVNGQRIFCKGGNWGMDDAMKQASREKLEPAFRLHRDAHFNMIRNWTGESTESAFYELADEYGIMIWNDFWMSTEGYNLNPNDEHLFLENTLDIIKKLRNHPSIAIWCPRNEGYAPPGIEDELATQLYTHDGTRHYHGNSRETNLRPSGDWHFIEDNTHYFTKYAKGFTTEIGTFSIPEASTIRTFIPEKDLWPINDVWHYHDLHADKQNLEGYLNTVNTLYGIPGNLDDFNRKVQLVNYESHRAMFEAFNSKMWNNTSGILIWMTHPAWPSMIWQAYSWDFETHGSYFGAKKACEPVHIQLNPDNDQISIINTSLDSYSKATVDYQIYNLMGKPVFSSKKNTDLASNSIQHIETGKAKSIESGGVTLHRLVLKNAKGEVISQNEYWKADNNTKHFQGFNDLANVTLKMTSRTTSQNQVSVTLTNASRTPAVGIKVNLCNDAKQIQLPAYVSDGYFTLLPGEKKTLQLTADQIKSGSFIRTIAYNSMESYHPL